MSCDLRGIAAVLHDFNSVTHKNSISNKRMIITNAPFKNENSPVATESKRMHKKIDKYPRDVRDGGAYLSFISYNL